MVNYLQPPHFRLSVPSAQTILHSVEHAPAVLQRSAAGAASYLDNLGSGFAQSAQAQASKTGLVAFLKNPTAPQFANVGIVVPAEGGAVDEGVAAARDLNLASYGEKYGGPISRIGTYLGLGGSAADKIAPVDIRQGADDAASVASGLKSTDSLAGGARSYASGFGQSLPGVGKATGSLVKYTIYGGAIGVSGALAGYGLTAVGAGVGSIGSGLSSLVYGSQPSQGTGGGGAGGATGGGTGSSDILGSIASSPLVIVAAVLIGGYLLVSHERKKNSQKSS